MVLASASVVAPVPPLATAKVPPSVMVPLVVKGPPVAVNPVVPPLTSTEVTVPVFVVYPASFVRMEMGSAGWTAESAKSPCAAVAKSPVLEVAAVPNPKLVLAVAPDSATHPVAEPTIKFPSAEESPAIAVRSAS